MSHGVHNTNFPKFFHHWGMWNSTIRSSCAVGLHAMPSQCISVYFPSKLPVNSRYFDSLLALRPYALSYYGISSYFTWDCLNTQSLLQSIPFSRYLGFLFLVIYSFSSETLLITCEVHMFTIDKFIYLILTTPFKFKKCLSYHQALFFCCFFCKVPQNQWL